MPKAEEKTETKAAAQRPGFDEKGKPYKGVDPETGERRTVVLSELKREFGPKTGEEMYSRIAQVAGGGSPMLQHRVEEDARDIGLDGADEEIRVKVSAILAGKE